MARTAQTSQPDLRHLQKKRHTLGHYLAATLILGLAAALCWCLPPLLMEWQDEKQVGKSYVQPAQPVVAATQEGMTLMERLNLLCNNTSATLDVITRGKQYPTESDAVHHALTELNALQTAGVLEPYENSLQADCGAGVLFTVDMNNSERSGLFWNGVVDTETWRFRWYMDDETGKLLGVFQSRHSDDEIWVDVWGKNFAIHIPENDGPAEWNYQSDEEVTAYITKWAEYLGCTVRETGRAEQIGFPGDDWAEVTDLMREEYHNRLSDVDLYYEVGQSLGYPVSFLYHLHYAIITDGSHSAVYYFSISDNLRFLWCLEAGF